MSIDTFNGDNRATPVGEFDFVAGDHRAFEIRRVVLRCRAALVPVASENTVDLAALDEIERIAVRVQNQTLPAPQIYYVIRGPHRVYLQSQQDGHREHSQIDGFHRLSCRFEYLNFKIRISSVLCLSHCYFEKGTSYETTR